MNKQKSTEQTKKQQKTWIKIIKIVGIVLICLILFALIAFGVLRALGKSGIRKNISGEAPVLESTESTEEGWQDGWIRYNGQIYAYNEDIMTFLVMGVDNDDVVKKAKDGLSGGQADARTHLHEHIIELRNDVGVADGITGGLQRRLTQCFWQS